MNYQMLYKYAACALLVASLFFLVLNHMMDTNQYIGLVLAILAGLGAYHAGVGGSSNDDSSPPPPPPASK